MPRDPSPEEVASKADFEEMQRQHDAAAAELAAAWEPVGARYRAALVQAASDRRNDVVGLAGLTTPVTGEGADALFPLLRKQAELAAAAVAAEALAQHLDIAPGVLSPGVLTSLAVRAAAVETLLVSGLALSAARRAVQGWSPASNADLPRAVSGHLEQMSPAAVDEHLSGAASQARNDGRRFALSTWPAGTTFYASELLDSRTCSFCDDVDGTEYKSIEDTVLDYPTGGYKDCLGGVRCRGTIVAVSPSEGRKI